MLVQVAADHTGRVTRIPTLGDDAIEFTDVLTQQLQVLPSLGQRRNFSASCAAAVDSRSDQEMRRLDLREHVLVDAEVAIAAERLLEPQVRGRYLLLHGLHQAHEERIALEVPRDQPLRINHDGDRYETYGNNTYDKRF